eukprot:scaffold76051_cov17-Tisochrysis_lutea.AAC.1
MRPLHQGDEEIWRNKPVPRKNCSIENGKGTKGHASNCGRNSGVRSRSDSMGPDPALVARTEWISKQRPGARRTRRTCKKGGL